MTWKTGILSLYLIILSYFDCKEKQVPIVALYVGGGGIMLLTLMELFAEKSTWQQLLGIIPGIFLIVVAAITKKVGLADGVALSMVGMVIGYTAIMLLFCVSLLLFSIISIALLFLHKVKGHTRLPYIPFLTVALIIQQVI